MARCRPRRAVSFLDKKESARGQLPSACARCNTCRCRRRSFDLMPNALLSPLAAQSFGRLESAARRLEAATGLLRDFSGCTDSEVDCARWARQGECQNNPGFMLTGCRASCASCESEACHNKHDSCRAWAEQGECSANTDFMLQTCPFACGVCGVNYKKECRREVSCPTHVAFGPRS